MQSPQLECNFTVDWFSNATTHVHCTRVDNGVACLSRLCTHSQPLDHGAWAAEVDECWVEAGRDDGAIQSGTDTSVVLVDILYHWNSMVSCCFQLWKALPWTHHIRRHLWAPITVWMDVKPFKKQLECPTEHMWENNQSVLDGYHGNQACAVCMYVCTRLAMSQSLCVDRNNMRSMYVGGMKYILQMPAVWYFDTCIFTNSSALVQLFVHVYSVHEAQKC